MVCANLSLSERRFFDSILGSGEGQLQLNSRRMLSADISCHALAGHWLDKQRGTLSHGQQGCRSLKFVTASRQWQQQHATGAQVPFDST